MKASVFEALVTVADSIVERATTIVPPARSESRAKATAFLAKLRERGQAVELRTGRMIGEGGMGVVHEAEQTALGRVVAVKTLKPDRSDPVAAQDLLREAWVTGALEHPNVVPIHHLEMAGDAPMLIMTRVDGVEWSTLIHGAREVERRFGETDLLAWNLDIFDSLLDALRFAHSRGIIHRDLKPANVMIGNFGEVYLLDWGIAVSLRDDDQFPLAREATELAGTPAYMAPEMLGADVGIPLSERTDVYVAGAVLYEIVVGRPPHQGANAPAIIASIVASDPQLPPSVPSELAAIVRRAMRPAPDDRFASIEELQLAVRRFLQHRGSLALAARAREMLDELSALCAGEPTDERRQSIYRALAICRFGFHEALSVWRENAEARAGIERATVAVAEYELHAGDPRAALALLDELDTPHPLAETVRAAATAHAQRRRELEQLEADHDPVPGMNVRWAVGLLVGGVYSIAPLVGAFYPRLSSSKHLHQLASTLASLAVIVGIGVWWSRTTRVTNVNRMIFQLAVVLFVAQSLMISGAWLVGLELRPTMVLMLFLWATIAAATAVTFDRYLLIAAAAYFAGFLVSARFPDLVQPAMGITNAIFTILVLVRWRSGHVRRPLSAK